MSSKFESFMQRNGRGFFKRGHVTRGLTRHPACSGLPMVKIGSNEAGRNPFVSYDLWFSFTRPASGLRGPIPMAGIWPLSVFDSRHFSLD